MPSEGNGIWIPEKGIKYPFTVNQEYLWYGYKSAYASRMWITR